MKKISLAMKRIYYHLYVICFLNRYYDIRNFKGKYFSHFRDIGWEWAYFDYKNNKRLNKNKNAKFPISSLSTVVYPENITFDMDDLNNFQMSGQYYQAIGKIIIGKGTYIAPNVGIITSNHDINNLDQHLEPKDVHIGRNCWVGMNSTILPGVTLGDGVIVGAGSVVTKSFIEPCIIGGVPASIIRSLK